MARGPSRKWPRAARWRMQTTGGALDCLLDHGMHLAPAVARAAAACAPLRQQAAPRVARGHALVTRRRLPLSADTSTLSSAGIRSLLHTAPAAAARDARRRPPPHPHAQRARATLSAAAAFAAMICRQACSTSYTPAPRRALAPRPRRAFAASRSVAPNKAEGQPHPDPSQPLYPGYQEEREVSHEAFMHAFEAARPKAMSIPGMQVRGRAQTRAQGSNRACFYRRARRRPAAVSGARAARGRRWRSTQLVPSRRRRTCARSGVREATQPPLTRRSLLPRSGTAAAASPARGPATRSTRSSQRWGPSGAIWDVDLGAAQVLSGVFGAPGGCMEQRRRSWLAL